MNNYLKYRGKCKELVDQAIIDDPTLTAVRGYYYDAQWGEQPHWWCKKSDGTIFDPTKDQFPSKGNGFYEEFDGKCTCEECGKEIDESEAVIIGNGNHVVCSIICYMKLVGVHS